MSHDLIWVENRRTPKVKTKGEKYEPTEAEGKIVKRRAATAEEEKVISRGDWVRVNEHGDKPSDSGYKRKKSKVRPGPHTNGAHTATFGTFLETVASQFVMAESSSEGYAGVTHAGIAMIAADTGRVLLAQRAMDETDDPDVQETWEFPGGGLGEGEDPWAGALREFEEEVGVPPTGEVIDGWRSEDGVYQGFVYEVPSEVDFGTGADPEEVQAVAWMDRAAIDTEEAHGRLRPEVTKTPWNKVFPETAEESPMPEDDIESLYSAESFDLDGPIPVHGVIAPEDLPSGDRRGFGKGAMTRRPLRLPFRDQHVDIGAHNGSVTIGSVDRMMRKGGLIHWEGALMNSEVSEPLVERMQFFDGRYGVSVDGDQGALDEARTEQTQTVWFEQLRAAGLTAVSIPAFHEAYVAFGHHPDMPSDDTMTAAITMRGNGDMIGARRETFDRGPGWITNPRETNRIHDYWTKPGQEGYAKVGWGTRGDFTRAKRLIGAKIAQHSPEKMKYLNQIIAQWHFDALGYWPGDLDKPGNKTSAEARAERAAGETVQAGEEPVDYSEVTRLLTESLASDDEMKRKHITVNDEEEMIWEAVLVSSAVSGNHRPPVSYFHQHPSMVEDPWEAESGALTVEDPDEFGFRRVWGYAAQWGVCHTGMDGRCVEPPRTYSDDYRDFHLGVTRVEGGKVYTGVLTYAVGHRNAKKILSESPEQAMFDNIKNAWASVRVGENDRGIWFSGVVLPKVDTGDLTLIEASGQVSGEWLAGEMRACLTVGTPGFPNPQASAEYDEFGNVLALAASAFGVTGTGPCNPEGSTEAADDPIGDLADEVALRIAARTNMDALRERWAKTEHAAMIARFNESKGN